ncbi:MAG TPA: hypothetical protein VGV40_07070 [Solirubrobacteraceae bacterium]|nr:hypothetical protein [Solirubrobacteraceae bacterium]
MDRPRWRDPLYLTRTVLPLAVILAGFVVLVVRRDTLGLEAFTLLLGAGASIWLVNFLYRLSISGDRVRDEEDRARAFFDRHGHWPDEAPPAREAPHRDKPARPAHRTGPSSGARHGAGARERRILRDRRR